MYSVSQDYLDALDAPVQIYRITGTVGSTPFTKANIVQGKFKITNKVSEGSEVKIGSVYIGELRATFTGLGIARGAWLGKVITVSEGLLVAEDTYEDVPLGVFTIAEAKHTLEGVEVVAYDAMANFDKRFSIDQTNGKAFSLLSYACTKCGVTLKNTQAQIEALPNGNTTLYLAPENDIETFRDFVSWIAQTMASVATIGREGKLEIRQYSTTSDMSVDEQHRFSGCSFSDFAVKYTGCSVVRTEEGMTRYASVTPDDGLIYNLGSNPFFQGIDYSTLQQALINSFSTISLVPFSAQMLGGAIFDLCDCLTFTGGVAAGAVVGVMGYSYTYNGGYKVEGYGSNPDLANARSKVDKDISGLISQTDLDKPRIFAFTNAEAITIGDGQTKTVAYLHVVAKKKTRFVLQVEVNHTAETTETETSTAYGCTDLNITGKIYINNVLQDFSPVEVEQDGIQGYFITFTEEVPQEGTEVRVDLTCSGGNISVAIGDVEAYLMGPGFDDFKIESITVVSVPSNLFQYGTVNYYGLEVDGVFNDGSQTDITSGCTVTPSEGTAISGDAESVHFTVTYDDFTEEFDAPVNPLFKVHGQLYGSIGSNPNNMPDYMEKTTNDIFAVWPRNGIDNGYKYAHVGYDNIVLDSDGIPTHQTIESYWRVFFDQYNSADNLVDLLHDGHKYYADARIMPIEKIEWFDLSDRTSGTITLTIHDPGTFTNPVTSVRCYRVNAYEASRAYLLDGYIVYPHLRVNGAYGEKAVGYVEAGQSDLYLLKHDELDTLGTWFGNDVRARNDNGDLVIERAHFNPLTLITYTTICTVEGKGGTIYSGTDVVGDTDLIRIVLDNDLVVVNTTTGAYLVFSSSDEGYKYIQNRTFYDSELECYITMARDTTAQYTYRSHQMFFSYDLVTWFGGGYLAPVGYTDSFDLNSSTFMVKDGDVYVGAVSALQDGVKAFSLDILADIGA